MKLPYGQLDVQQKWLWQKFAAKMFMAKMLTEKMPKTNIYIYTIEYYSAFRKEKISQT